MYPPLAAFVSCNISMLTVATGTIVLVYIVNDSTLNRNGTVLWWLGIILVDCIESDTR